MKLNQHQAIHKVQVQVEPKIQKKISQKSEKLFIKNNPPVLIVHQ